MHSWVTWYVTPTGDTTISSIAEALCVNTTLETLLVAANPFHNDGGISLATALCEHNTSLRVLDIKESRMTLDLEKQVCHLSLSLSLSLSLWYAVSHTHRLLVILRDGVGSVNSAHNMQWEHHRIHSYRNTKVSLASVCEPNHTQPASISLLSLSLSLSLSQYINPLQSPLYLPSLPSSNYTTAV